MVENRLRLNQVRHCQSTEGEYKIIAIDQDAQKVTIEWGKMDDGDSRMRGSVETGIDFSECLKDPIRKEGDLLPEEEEPISAGDRQAKVVKTLTERMKILTTQRKELNDQIASLKKVLDDETKLLKLARELESKRKK